MGAVRDEAKEIIDRVNREQTHICRAYEHGETD